MSFRSLFAALLLALCVGMAFGAMPASAAPYSNTYSTAGAIDIVGTRGKADVDLAGATRESGEPVVAGSATDHTVWWRYIPAATGFVRFSTCAQTGMNPVPGLSLGLYTGSQVNLLTTVSQATNNCPAGFENAVLGPVAVTAGNYYWLQIGGATTLAAGETDLSVTMDFNAAIPANDNWASSTLISGALPQTFAANNGLATTEVAEPRSDALTERQSLWYRWTATADGTISVNNCGSLLEAGEDSVIGVFTGTTPATAADMTYVNDNDNGCPGAAASLSRVYVPVTNGTKYWFKLSNQNANYGFPYSLQIKWVTSPENGQLPAMYPTRFKVGTATNVDSDGTWGGYPTPTYTRQWRKCDSAGANCTNIAGATGMSYTPVAGDVGSTIVLRVTATNSNGSASADSIPSEVVDTTPSNDLWANAYDLGNGGTITRNDDNNWATHNEAGEPTIGSTLARNTVWYKWTAPTTATYMINNCLGAASGLDYLDLMIGVRTGAGPVGSTVAAGSGDDGCGPYHPYRTSMLFGATAGTVYWIEVASKTAGFTGNFTLSISIPGNPQVTVMPSISGTAAPGGLLNLDIGDWISPTGIAPVIHWYRCDSAGASCVDTGQSGVQYTVVPADAGGKLKATVGLTNSYGTVTNAAFSAVVALDSDGDGVLDGSDSCPSEAGNRPNGCMPSDVVGMGDPTISGNLVTGQTLSSSTGTWSVLHDPLGYTLTYQWQRCNDSTPGSCANIGGATNSTYTLVAGDLTKTIRVAVTATNPDDFATQYSAQTAAIGSPPPPPSNTALPVVSGTMIVGQSLSATDGTWTPAGVTFGYEWQRCTDNASVGTCTTISGETASSYTLAAADLGKYMRIKVTGNNSSGSSAVFSAATSIVLGDDDGDGVPNTTDVCPSEAGTKPNGCLPSDIVGTGNPSVAGSLVVGQTVSASGDTWNVLHDPLGYSLSYQWQRCNDATPGSCSNIPSASSNTYVLTGAEYQKRVRVIVTATNADDAATQTSANSAAIDQLPGNTVAPALSGTPRVTAALSTTAGTWTPAGTTFTYSWLRCTDTVSPASCTTIPSQTGTSYTLVAADDGKYIRSRVTGTTTAGSVSAESAPSAKVITDGDADGVPDATDACPGETGTKPNGCLPSDIVGAGVPTIGIPGTFNVGDTISSSTGTWNVLHDQLGYTLSYQWQRCNDATVGSCSSIAGGVSSTYVLAAADYGKKMRVVVTATNADDVATQASAITLPSVSQLPSNVTPPSVTGTARVGQTLSGSQGTWTPGDASLSYAWQRCTDNVSGASCSMISGATNSTYTLVAADDNKYIRLYVGASTSAGTSGAYSAATAKVTTDTDGDGVIDSADTCPTEAGTKPNGCLPGDIVGAGVPTISGTLNVGQTASSTTGSWTVLHDPLGYALTYQWQRCPDLTPANCVNIAGATSNTYSLVAADYGKRVRVTVTATNTDDTASQSSGISALVSQTPANTVLPSVTGTPKVGQILTGAQGTWTPADATLTNAWLRCNDTTLGSCTPIASQTGSTYTLVAADDLKYIRLQVSGATTAGTVVATSNPTVQITTTLDGDGDGVPDASDTCPAEAGTKPNGCLPSVIVAGGAPTLSGTFNTGQTITSTTGTWSVLHDPLGYTLSYQWQRCSTVSVGSCTNIASATSNTYALTGADYGNRVRVTVTATNADDAKSQSSAISAQISQVPANSVLPSVSGTAKVGNSLTGAQGTWTPGDATLSNAWLRCTTTLIGSCSTIAGQTGASYTLVAADDGKYIRLQVSATTTAGTVVATSAGTAQVITDTDGDGIVDASDTCPAEAGTKPNGCLPSDIVGAGVPTISGTLNVGQTASSTTGTWNVLHDPLGATLAYQWQRCPDLTAANCVNIGGATASTYVLTASEYGKRVRVNVTATNPDDTALQSSAISAVVSQAPVNNTLPTVSGTAKVGQSIASGPGTWTPADASLSYAWLRCTTTSVGSCSTIASQTGTSYTLVAADDGKYIRVQVTGTTAAGSAVATSAVTAQIFTDTDNDGVVDSADACPAEAGTKPNGCLPSDIVAGTAPTLSGNLVVGSTMTATTGTWSVLHDQLGYTLSYQWQRCDDATAGSCADIGSATASTYALTASELNKRVRVVVTATNADDVQTQSSAISTAVIPAGSPPVNNTAPTISGTAEVGQQLTATGSASDWTPASAVLTYEWLRCTDSNLANCVPIGSATASTYTLVAADAGALIRVRVTATASALSAQVTSAATAQITVPVVAPPAGGGSTPPVATPPNLGTVTGPANLKTMKPSKKGLVNFSKVSVYCGSKSPGNCLGSAVLTGKIGSKVKTLGTLKLSSLPGGGRLLAVKISKAALKALAKKQIKAQLSVSYGSPGATPASYLGKVTLKKP